MRCCAKPELTKLPLAIGARNRAGQSAAGLQMHRHPVEAAAMTVPWEA